MENIDHWIDRLMLNDSPLTDDEKLALADTLRATRVTLREARACITYIAMDANERKNKVVAQVGILTK